MRWAIDLDGVVANYISAMVRIANDLRPGSFPDNWQPTGWDLPFSKDVFKTFNNSFNAWMTLDPYRENVRAIASHRIAHPSDEIYYVTARKPTKGLPVTHQSQRWLEMCGIGGVGTSVISSEGNEDKHSTLKALQINAFVDDKLDEILVNMAKGGPHLSYLLSRPWNKEGRWEGVRVVPNLALFFREASRGANGTKV